MIQKREYLVWTAYGRGEAAGECDGIGCDSWSSLGFISARFGGGNGIGGGNGFAAGLGRGDGYGHGRGRGGHTVKLGT